MLENMPVFVNFELLYQDNLRRDISSFMEQQFQQFLAQQMLANKIMMEVSMKENKNNGAYTHIFIGAIMILCFIGGCFIWTQNRQHQKVKRTRTSEHTRHSDGSETVRETFTDERPMSDDGGDEDDSWRGTLSMGKMSIRQQLVDQGHV